MTTNGKPLHIHIKWSDEDSAWIAWAEALRGMGAHGDSPEHALKELLFIIKHFNDEDEKQRNCNHEWISPPMNVTDAHGSICVRCGATKEEDHRWDGVTEV